MPYSESTSTTTEITGGDTTIRGDLTVDGALLVEGATSFAVHPSITASSINMDNNLQFVTDTFQSINGVKTFSDPVNIATLNSDNINLSNNLVVGGSVAFGDADNSPGNLYQDAGNRLVLQSQPGKAIQFNQGPETKLSIGDTGATYFGDKATFYNVSGDCAEFSGDVKLNMSLNVNNDITSTNLTVSDTITHTGTAANFCKDPSDPDQKFIELGSHYIDFHSWTPLADYNGRIQLIQNNMRLIADQVTIKNHDGVTQGLKLGNQLVKSSAAELNILSGATITTDELNSLHGRSIDNSLSHSWFSAPAGVDTFADIPVNGDNQLYITGTSGATNIRWLPSLTELGTTVNLMDRSNMQITIKRSDGNNNLEIRSHHDIDNNAMYLNFHPTDNYIRIVVGTFRGAYITLRSALNNETQILQWYVVGSSYTPSSDNGNEPYHYISNTHLAID